jgi:hypothetical protein
MAVELDTQISVRNHEITGTPGFSAIRGLWVGGNGDVGIGLFPTFELKIASQAVLVFYDEVQFSDGKTANRFGTDFRWSF